MAASTIAGGVAKSGSPAPKPMTSAPAAFSALALASTASVADSAMEPIRLLTRARTGEVGTVLGEGEDVMASMLSYPAAQGPPGIPERGPSTGRSV